MKMLYRISCITAILMLCLSTAIYSQEEVTEGSESFESIRAFTKIKPLFIGLSYEQLFPPVLNSSFIGFPYNGYIGKFTKVNLTSPLNSEPLFFSIFPSVIVGVEFPYVFGLSLPFSTDLYSKIGVSYRTIGELDASGFYGLSSMDFHADFNVRIYYPLHRFSTIGLYVTTGLGVLIPIQRGFGYYTSEFSIDKGSNYIEFDTKNNLDMFVNLGAGFVLQQLQGKNFKVILGYVVKWFVFQEDYIHGAQDINSDISTIYKLSLKGINFHGGVQLEIIYSIY